MFNRAIDIGEPIPPNAQELATLRFLSAPLDLETLLIDIPNEIAQAVRVVFARVIQPRSDGGLGATVRGCGPTLIHGRFGESYVDDNCPVMLIADADHHRSAARRIDTVFHEAVHLTGLPGFLHRFETMPRNPQSIAYFIEDAVAWKGAALLCRATGVATLPDPEDYAGTIGEARQYLKRAHIQELRTDADAGSDVLARAAAGFLAPSLISRS